MPQSDRPPNTFLLTCPHCNQELLAYLSTGISKVERLVEGQADGVGNKDDRWWNNLDPAQRTLLDKADKCGLLACYDAALKASATSYPNNIKKHFLGFLRMMRQKVVPSWVLGEFMGLYPKQFVEFYAANGVGCVVADGAMVMFVPATVISGTHVKNHMTGKLTLGPVNDHLPLREWAKTRNGYVPVETRMMLATMRTRSIGEFANPVMGGV